MTPYKPYSETHEQIAVMEWASYHPICKDYLIHIPNGGYRHPLEARKLKRMGVKSGVSDLFLAYPNGVYHGWWGEGKRPTGILTDNQARWRDLMLAVGFQFDVWHTADEAICFINAYIPSITLGA